MPEASVTAVGDDSVARAPLPGPANVTVTPGTGVPLLSSTSTASAEPNAVDTVVLCGEPLDTVVVAGTSANVAVTLCAPAMVTLHVVDVPLHAPPQPTNVPPVIGVAVSTTCELSRKSAASLVHSVPQLIAAGTELTEPAVVVPCLVTVSVRSVPIVSVSTAVSLVESGSVLAPVAVTVAVLTTELVPLPLMIVAWIV